MKSDEQRKEFIHVTMHVASRKTAEELRGNKQIQSQVDAALRELMHPVQSGEKLARRLSLPPHVHIQWSVEIAALKEGFHTHEGHIPIMVSVAGVPNIMKKLQPEMVEEVTNILFNEIRKESSSSRELAKALGYDDDKPAKLHLYLPHQVRVRGSALPAGYGDGDGDGDGDGGDGGPPVWLEGGWSKGCSSWPW
jgi:hypothetical protein